MWLLALFIAVPLIEIALFIQIGGAIGLGWTLLIVVLTAALGTWLVRNQGIRAIAQLRDSPSDLSDPPGPLFPGAMILFAGALLLTPGFFTGTVGFLLLAPPVRVAIHQFLRKRVRVQRFEMGRRPGPRTGPDHPAGPGGTIIDGEYEEVTPPKRPTHGNSGWTRH